MSNVRMCLDSETDCQIMELQPWC